MQNQTRTPSFEQLKRALRGAKSDHTGVISARSIADHISRENGGEGVRQKDPLLKPVSNFLWDCVRAGFLVPTKIGWDMDFDQSRFFPTQIGRDWFCREVEDPFRPNFVIELANANSLFAGEPATIVTEARRAADAGLDRAALILIGLAAETMVFKMFDDGVQSGKVKPKKPNKKRPSSKDIQQDVKTAIEVLETNKSVENGSADEWFSHASTYRTHRNACAHDSGWEPTTGLVHAAFFAWHRFVSLSQLVYDELK